MAQMSNYLETNLINHVFRNATFSTPGSVYAALYSTDPTDADSGTELTGDGYARKEALFGVPSDGVTVNSADIVFDTATLDWDEVTHVGVRDALTGGNLLMHKILTTPVSTTSGNNFRIAATDLEITFA